jgi:hypothetical protein
MPEDGQYYCNMYLVLTRLLKLVVVDGSMYGKLSSTCLIIIIRRRRRSRIGEDRLKNEKASNYRRNLPPESRCS